MIPLAPRTIDHDELLAERAAQLLGNGACKDVARAPAANGTMNCTGFCG
jgi:hypothetical protein